MGRRDYNSQANIDTHFVVRSDATSAPPRSPAGFRPSTFDSAKSTLDSARSATEHTGRDQGSEDKCSTRIVFSPIRVKPCLSAVKSLPSLRPIQNLRSSAKSVVKAPFQFVFVRFNSCLSPRFPAGVRLSTPQNRLPQLSPITSPFSSISICSAAGTSGRPGMRMMSPQIGIRKPAPAAISISRTVNVKSWGRPSSAG